MTQYIEKSSSKQYLSNSKILYADIETVFINNIHQPIGIGYSNLTGTISNVYLLTYNSKNIKDGFLRILTQFIIDSQNSTIYFHNLSSFDGFLLLKSLYNILPLKKNYFYR